MMLSVGRAHQPGPIKSAAQDVGQKENFMEKIDYHKFERAYIGSSDYATLVLVGNTPDGVKASCLHFGWDDGYLAYIVDATAKIEEHYTLVAQYEDWLRVYDDTELTRRFDAPKIEVFRAGAMGCIIRLLGEDSERA